MFGRGYLFLKTVAAVFFSTLRIRNGLPDPDSYQMNADPQHCLLSGSCATWCWYTGPWARRVPTQRRRSASWSDTRATSWSQTSSVSTSHPSQATHLLPGLGSHVGFRKGYPPPLPVFLVCSFLSSCNSHSWSQTSSVSTTARTSQGSRSIKNSPKALRFRPRFPRSAFCKGL